MDDQILTLQEVSKYLKLHKATVYKMAQAGKIPALKVGKVWRFKRTKLEVWLERQEDGTARKRRRR
jgi:excisionase family DNA binding protein